MSAILFSYTIGPTPIDCTLEEEHESEMAITEITLEDGSVVTDHAFTRPKRVTLEIADSKGAVTYNALVLWQSTRIPFVLVTGLSIYPNMLIKNIRARRSKELSSVFRATVTLQEVLFNSGSFLPASLGSIASLAGGLLGGTNSLRAVNPTSNHVLSAFSDKVTGIRHFGDIGTAAPTLAAGNAALSSIL